MKQAYPNLISENADELKALEKELKNSPSIDRLTMLRLLKTGKAPSLKQCSALIGRSESSLQHWFKLYLTGGISTMLAQKPRLGPKSRLTQKAWLDLATQIRAGRIASAEDARKYLEDNHQITYRTTGAVWWMLYRNGAKLEPEASYNNKKSRKRIWMLD